MDEPAGTPESSGPGGLVRLRLDVAYDGTDFHGWARQPGLRSVQGELEAALRAVLRVPAAVPVRVAVAGRTDAGVHATGQVCHCDVPAASGEAVADVPPRVLAVPDPTAPRTVSLPDWNVPPGIQGGTFQSRRRVGEGGGREDREAGSDPEAGSEPEAGHWVRRRLNGLLAADLRVRRVSVAPEGFDARWSALWRRYEYWVADDPACQDPRTRAHVLWHPRPVDVAAMDAAARPFVGEHDFAAYCRARPDASSVRTVHEIGWRRVDGLIGFGIRADAFCHSMVRALVGAFLAVGDGRWPVQHPAELLASAVRVPTIATAPAHGLTLVEVGYPAAEADLAAQALRAKRWRGR